MILAQHEAIGFTLGVLYRLLEESLKQNIFGTEPHIILMDLRL